MHRDWAKKFDPNNYEFNHEKKIGILLIHGFTNTTYEIKDLAIYLSSKNYYIKAQNLAGHGTTIDNCNNTIYSDWLSDVEQQVASMSTHCEQLFVVGVSMGGALALHLASMFPLNGIVAAATVLTFHKQFKINFLVPILNKIIKKRPKQKEIPYKSRGIPEQSLEKYHIIPEKFLNNFWIAENCWICLRGSLRGIGGDPWKALDLLMDS